MKKTALLTFILLMLAAAVMLAGCDEGEPEETVTDTVYTEVTTAPAEETTDSHVCEFGEWETVREATCTENGLRRRSCECGKTEEEGITAGHSYAVTVILPTINAEGYTVHTCRVCGDSYEDSKTDKLTPSEGLEFMDNPDGEGVVVKGIGSFAGTDVVIPETSGEKKVTGIWLQAFYGNESITSVTIPEGVTFIGDMAFDNCKNLKTVAFPSTLTSIGEYAFFGCESLSFAVLPDSLETIDKCAFTLCSKLERVVFGKGIKSLGDSLFSCCTALADVTYAGTEEEWAAVEKPDNWNYLCRYLVMYFGK